MGSRDYKQRETKKPKKAEKKKPLGALVITPPVAEPEIVGRRRPPKEEV